MTDLELAYNALRGKNAHHSLRWDYYHGRQPLKWTSTKMGEVFGSDQSDYVMNWCAPLVDAVTNRLVLEGFQISNSEELTNALADLFDSTGLALDADAVHQEADICGESFVIAWPDGDTIEAYHNDARNVHLFYQEDRPRVKRFAAKWWIDADEHRRMTLYYPERLEYWRSTKKASEMTDFNAKQWESQGAADNPFGQIPVFHFRLSASGAGDLDNALPLQDIVNKTVSDLVVAGEFTSFPQRWMITRAEMPDGGLPISPSEAWKLPPADGEDQDVSVGQFAASDLQNFLKVLDHTAQSMASITATPKHMFWGQSGTPSGEALMALESPLVKKVNRYINRLQSTWRELAAFLLLLDGRPMAKISSIVPIFADVRTIQPLTESITLQNDVSSGIPLVNLLRDRGWTEADLAQLKTDQADDIPQLYSPALPPEPDTEDG